MPIEKHRIECSEEIRESLKQEIAQKVRAVIRFITEDTPLEDIAFTSDNLADKVIKSIKELNTIMGARKLTVKLVGKVIKVSLEQEKPAADEGDWSRPNLSES